MGCLTPVMLPFRPVFLSCDTTNRSAPLWICSMLDAFSFFPPASHISAALSGLSPPWLLYLPCSHHCSLVPSLSWMLYLTPAFIHSFGFYFTATASPGCTCMELVWVSSTHLCSFYLCFPAQATSRTFSRPVWAPLSSVPLTPWVIPKTAVGSSAASCCLATL